MQWILVMLVLSLWPGRAQADITSNLQLWWQLEGNATDSSGSANNGTLQNTPTFVAGKIGQAVSINGTNQYITFAAPRQANTIAYTIALWAKTTSTAAGKRLYNESGTGSRKMYLASNENVTGDLQWATIDDAGGSFFCDSGGDIGMTNGQWHLIVLVQTSKSARSMYMDNMTTPRCTDTTTIGTATMTASFVGTISGSSGFFAGQIDELRSYNRALSLQDRHELLMYGSTRKRQITLR